MNKKKVEPLVKKVISKWSKQYESPNNEVFRLAEKAGLFIIDKKGRLVFKVDIDNNK